MDTQSITRTEQLPDGVVVLFDGGCKGNNLPVSRVSEREMYGSIAVFCNRKRVEFQWSEGMKTMLLTNTFDHVDGHASSPLSEYVALEYALVYICKLLGRNTKSGKPVTSLTVVGDNETAVGFGSGTHQPQKKSHPSIHTEYDEIVRMIGDIEEAGCKLEWRNANEKWVKTQLGH